MNSCLEVSTNLCWVPSRSARNVVAGGSCVHSMCCPNADIDSWSTLIELLVAVIAPELASRRVMATWNVTLSCVSPRASTMRLSVRLVRLSCALAHSDAQAQALLLFTRPQAAESPVTSG